MEKNTVQFEIYPYVGAGPLKFGMSPEEVAKGVGPPDGVRDRGEEIRELREKNDLHVVYTKNGGRVVEIGFGKGIKSLKYDGIYVFEENPNDVVRHIIKSGNKAYESLGFLVFLDIGIAFTGFHGLDADNDEEDDNGQKAVTVFKSSRWEDVKPKLAEYKI